MACSHWRAERRCRAGLALLLVAALAACGPGRRGSDPPLGATGRQTAHGLPELRNPFAGDAAASAAGAQIYAQRACVTCHGNKLTGAMCPSLVNQRWVYGDDDTTLFFLLRDGSVALRGHGYTRSGQEPQIGDMAGFGRLLDDRELWQLVSFVRAQQLRAD